MKNHTNRILTVLTLLVAYGCGIIGYAPQAKAQNLKALLDSLDYTIAHYDSYAAQKQTTINRLHRQLAQKQQPADRYSVQSLLYDEYYVFDADSAMAICNSQQQIADELNNADWKAEWLIKRSFILAATGMLDDADNELKSLYGSKLPPALRTEYYRQKIYIYSHKQQYLGDVPDGNSTVKSKNEQADVLQQLYNDSILLTVAKTDPLYLWQMAWGPDAIKVKIQLEKALAECKLDSRYDAMNAYSLAHIYDLEGNTEARMAALVKSAIADVRCCNHDVASLEELARLLYERGDLERAYSYINYCIRGDQAYHNRVRMVTTSQIFADIHHASVELQHRQRRWLNIGLVLLLLFSIILAIAIVQLVIRIRRSRRERQALAEANRQQELANAELIRSAKALEEMVAKYDKANGELSDVNAQLSDVVGQLRESNYIKEETMGMAFTLCSNYISQMDDQRKTFARMLKTNQHDLLRRQLEKSLTSAQLKEFFRHFDQLFLNIYPDFIDDFNALLRPDERILPKEGDLLNTELRIYALVRLGINDSVKIADFLHCSPQTVYNYRLRVRNKSDIPNSQFAEAVQRLGKASR